MDYPIIVTGTDLPAPVDVNDHISCDPPEDAECYLGMHYKVTSVTNRQISLLLWNRMSHEWSDATIPLHPASTPEQRSHLIHNLIAETARVHASAEKSMKEHPSYHRGN
jgi:hypothetical protein